jgi:hypothetical protein
MIIRIALFITLLAIFYFYCREDNTAHQLRGPNDINLIDVPAELFPDFMSHPHVTTTVRNDSPLYRLTAVQPLVDDNSISINHPAQNN